MRIPSKVAWMTLSFGREWMNDSRILSDVALAMIYSSALLKRDDDDESAEGVSLRIYYHLKEETKNK